MKTFKQFINEWSSTDVGVNVYMIKKGYHKLGKGVDQTAWIKPGDNHVIKIFGTQGGTHSADHMMFKFWAEYCEKHKNNKFLPKILGWEAFEWNDEKYLQIKMELLTKLPEDIGVALQDVFAYSAINKNASQRMQYFKDIISMPDSSMNRQIEKDGIANLAMLIGADGFKQLFETIVDLGNIGRKYKWGIDLHRGNFMMRADGTPVIVDPWVV